MHESFTATSQYNDTYHLIYDIAGGPCHQVFEPLKEFWNRSTTHEVTTKTWRLTFLDHHAYL